MSAAQRRLSAIVTQLISLRRGEGLDMLDECIELLRDEPRVDAVLFARACSALRAHGFEREELPSYRPLKLEPGEALVLLVRDNVGTTAILRARAGHGRVPTECEAPRSALDAVIAFRRTLAAQRRSALCDELSLVSGFEIDLLAAELCEIEGDSLGLAAVAAAVSLCLRRPIASGVACAAAVTEARELAPVRSIDSKIIALRAEWPEVQRVIVAESQPAFDGRGLQIVRASYAAAALRVLGLPVSSSSAAKVLLTLFAALIATRVASFKGGAADHDLERFSQRASAAPSAPAASRDVRSLVTIAPAMPAVNRSSAAVRRTIASNPARGRRTEAAPVEVRVASRDAGVAPLATANQAPLLHP
jgi:hypothetical protein